MLGSCAEAQDAAALLIATAIDPAAVMRTPPPRPELPPRPPEPPAPPVRPHAWSLLARGLLDGKSLPAASAGVEAGVLFASARHRLWSEARYLFARRTERGPGADVGADVDLFSAAAGGAYVWPFGAFVVGPAAELELGVLRAQGVAPAEGVAPRTRAAPWAAAGLGGIAGYAVHRRIGLELSLLAGLPLWRPRLTVRDDASFYTTSWWTMRVAVGVRVSLGSL